jgi:acyl carrier protein
MIPTAWVALDRLPLTPNGKVDRKQLPAPGPAEQASPSDSIEPRTQTEEVLAAIWSEVLKLDRIGLEDHFFELGGHSLLATQVVSRVRQSFHVDLQLRALFEAPTVAALSQTIEQMMRGKAGVIAPPIVKVPRDQPLPLSFAQQRLWFQDQMEPDSSQFNMPRALRLKGQLSVPCLEAALNGIVHRHEILRTTYATDPNGNVFQVIAPELTLPLPVIDLCELPVADREKEARWLAQREVATPIDLAKGPVMRSLLVRIADDDHLLIINTHHIASDGWSRGVLIRELVALYEAALHNRPDPLPELPIQYADFGVWQRNWLQGEILDRQLRYWKARLEGAPPLLALPTDHPRPATPAYRGATHHFLLSNTLVAVVSELGRRRGATPFMVLLAAFQCMILYFTRNPDMVLGTDLANRTNRQTEDLIGFFVNLVVLRTDLSGDPSFEELLGRVREVALEAYAHQDVPFEKLVEELQPERNPSYHPLVQVLFVQQNTPRNTLPMPGVEMTPFVLDVHSRFDMAVFLSQADEGLSGYWLYNPDIFEAGTVSRMAGLFQLILETVTANPAANISHLMQLLAYSDQQQRQAQNKEFQELSLQKLKSVRRRAVTYE